VAEALRRAPLKPVHSPELTLETPLSPREIEVLRLVAEGKSDREIGEILEISRHTAVRHVANIFLKLDVNTRTHAAIYAFEHGLVPDQPNAPYSISIDQDLS
jgi:DNA-binding CsgD family transcriptional regulator